MFDEVYILFHFSITLDEAYTGGAKNVYTFKEMLSMCYFLFHFNIILYLTKHIQGVPKMYTHFKRCYVCITFYFILILYYT